MPIKDRPRRDNSNTEWPDNKEPQDSRFMSVPIGSDPDLDDDDDPDEEAVASQDRAVERWLNGTSRSRH